MIGALLLILALVVLICAIAAYVVDRVPGARNTMGPVRWAGLYWANYVYAQAVPNTRRVALEVHVRWWHPGAWALFMRAVLRKYGVLAELCPTCSGNGRLMKRHGSTQRLVCPECHGRKYRRAS